MEKPVLTSDDYNLSSHTENLIWDFEFTLHRGSWHLIFAVFVSFPLLCGRIVNAIQVKTEFSEEGQESDGELPWSNYWCYYELR